MYDWHQEVRPMSLVSYAALPLASGVNTTMSEGGLVVLSVGAMVCVAALLIPVNLAARTPHRPGPGPAPMLPGNAAVTAGVQPGDGHSIAPQRDEPAVPSGQGQAAPAPAAREGEGTAGQG
jgi:hypothetical protein